MCLTCGKSGRNGEFGTAHSGHSPSAVVWNLLSPIFVSFIQKETEKELCFDMHV
jgi:hypothetical protein